MDLFRVQSLVDQLEDNIDDLEDGLQPVISQALSESAKNLPLLDKAKLHIVIVYAIESLLFSYLKLHDVDAKQHPVFRELTRVKQYFEKVKSAEEGSVQPRENMSLNKEAAARIIKHSLAGNDRLDLARLEREAREKLLARRKLKDLDSTSHEKSSTSTPVTPTAEEELMNEITTAVEKAQNDPALKVVPQKTEGLKAEVKDKKRKRKEAEEPSNASKAAKSKESKAAKKAKKKAKKEAKAATEAASQSG